MNIQDRINENFTRENIVNTVASYQLYYQLAVGVYVKETSFDQKETMKKVQDLNLDIEPENVLNTMVKLISGLNEEENFKTLFDENIKANAMLHALDDFIGKNEELTNKETTYKTYSEKIQNEDFYNINMHVQFDDEIKDRRGFWEKLITDDIAKELNESACKVV